MSCQSTSLCFVTVMKFEAKKTPTIPRTPKSLAASGEVEASTGCSKLAFVMATGIPAPGVTTLTATGSEARFAPSSSSATAISTCVPTVGIVREIEKGGVATSPINTPSS